MHFKVLVYFVIFVKLIISNVFSFLSVLWRKESTSFADPAMANLFVLEHSNLTIIIIPADLIV